MKQTTTRALALASLLVPSLTFAGTPDKDPATPAPAPAKDDKSGFDELWGFDTLYKNDSNPIIQEFKLRGRYQGQYAWVDSDQGNFDDWENRRSRLGFDAKLFEK